MDKPDASQTPFARELAERDKKLAAYPRLVAAIVDTLEVIRDYEDVRDGSDGRQLPNAAMSLGQELEALLKSIGE